MEQAIIIDIETTGLDPQRDKIIEIGMIRFAWSGGEMPTILQTYSALEDPGFPISEEIRRLTGLNNEVLLGQSINWGLVRELLEESSLIIAHNAEFDLGFLLRKPELRGLDLHYACSLRHVDWNSKGFKSLALNYLAADHGFVNPFAHRALFDCATTFKLVAPHLAELLSRSFEKEFLVYAWQAPFAKKDELRLRGYRWNGEKRVWVKKIFESGKEQELSFLDEQVYGDMNSSWACEEMPHLAAAALTGSLDQVNTSGDTYR